MVGNQGHFPELDAVPLDFPGTAVKPVVDEPGGFVILTITEVRNGVVVVTFSDECPNDRSTANREGLGETTSDMVEHVMARAKKLRCELHVVLFVSRRVR